MNITSAQLRRLHVVYGQFERHSLDAGPARQDRITWASSRIGRTIASFNDLTLDEARKLIDGLQSAVGKKFPSTRTRRAQTRRDGEKKGTEGRRDQIHNETTLVGPGELALIQADLNRLGWDEARLKAFLTSSRGPNKGSATIRTLGDANRVHWALKRMTPSPQEVA